MKFWYYLEIYNYGGIARSWNRVLSLYKHDKDIEICKDKIIIEISKELYRELDKLYRR